MRHGEETEQVELPAQTQIDSVVLPVGPQPDVVVAHEIHCAVKAPEAAATDAQDLYRSSKLYVGGTYHIYI